MSKPTDLGWKAIKIIENEFEESRLKRVVLLLGGFHTRMSFLNSIGTVGKGSGLFEALRQVYPTNTVKNILTGKCVARAERGHLMVATALNTAIMQEAYGPDPDKHPDIQAMALLLEPMLDGTVQFDAQDLSENDSILNVEEKISQAREEIKCRSPTGEYWIQYLTMVELLRDFRRAEYTGTFSHNV